jgi:hypothetical protein
MEVEVPTPDQIQQADESEAPIPAPPTGRQTSYTAKSSRKQK